MQSLHFILFTLVSFMLVSSGLCLLFVTIENYKAVKKYYKAKGHQGSSSDVNMDFEPSSTTFINYDQTEYILAS